MEEFGYRFSDPTLTDILSRRSEAISVSVFDETTLRVSREDSSRQFGAIRRSAERAGAAATASDAEGGRGRHRWRLPSERVGRVRPCGLRLERRRRGAASGGSVVVLGHEAGRGNRIAARETADSRLSRWWSKSDLGWSLSE